MINDSINMRKVTYLFREFISLSHYKKNNQGTYLLIQNNKKNKMLLCLAELKRKMEDLHPNQ